jgi:hypothetical protein
MMRVYPTRSQFSHTSPVFATVIQVVVSASLFNLATSWSLLVTASASPFFFHSMIFNIFLNNVLVDLVLLQVLNLVFM